jgi:hypothetical protein
MASFFGKIGRRKVDRDALMRQRKADSRERGTDSFPAFHDGLISQSDDVKVRIAGRNVYLHVHFARLDALEGDRVDMSDAHGRTPAFGERSMSMICVPAAGSQIAPEASMRRAVILSCV